MYTITQLTDFVKTATEMNTRFVMQTSQELGATYFNYIEKYAELNVDLAKSITDEVIKAVDNVKNAR